MVNSYIVSGKLVGDCEIEAVRLYFNGEPWYSSTFNNKIICGYGLLSDYDESFQYELPLWFRKEYNILGGCKTWSEWNKKLLREKKIKRILYYE